MLDPGNQERMGWDGEPQGSNEAEEARWKPSEGRLGRVCSCVAEAISRMFTNL